MGFILRLFGWLWRRFGDWNDAVQLADLIDIKTTLVGLASIVVMIFYGALNQDWSAQTVVVVAIGAGAGISIIFIGSRMALHSFLQRRKVDTSHTTSSTPSIELLLAEAELEKQRRLALKEKRQASSLSTWSSKTRELAGLVNAIMERALSFDFRLPLRSDDPFVRQHDDLKKSEHPAWIDHSLNQLRRDFLNRCHRLGAREEVSHSAEEVGELRTELQDIGRKIIAHLLADEVQPSVAVSAEHRAEPDLNAAEGFKTIFTRSIWAKDQVLHPEAMPEVMYEVSMRSDSDRLVARLKSKLDQEIHDLLGLGKLMAWGRVDGDRPPKLIKPEEWQEIELHVDDRSLSSSPPNICAWRRRGDLRGGDHIAYVQVMFCSTQLYRQYPLLDAPFSMPTNSTVGRIPFINFRDVVRDAYHWNISGKDNLEIVDLFDGLRQAGIDETVRFWGRFNRYGTSDLNSNEPLVPIPSDHWRKFQFEWGAAINASNNKGVITYNFYETENRLRGNFSDIHIHKGDAIIWMNNEASAFRGNRDREEKQRSR